MIERLLSRSAVDAMRQRLAVDPLGLGEMTVHEIADMLAVWPPDRVQKMSNRYSVIRPDEAARNLNGAIRRYAHGRRMRRSVLPASRQDRRIDFGQGLSLRFTDDHPAAQAFMRRVLPMAGLHEPELIAHLRRTVRQGDTVVDVGAHVGYVSCVVAALGATVLAIEMQPTLIPIIQLNAAINDLWNVHALCVALSDKAGLATLPRVTPSPGLQNSGGLEGRVDYPVASPNHDLVPVLRLDELTGGKTLPSLVKIDVEGAEGHVLAGAENLIRAGDTSFVVEVHAHLLDRFGTILDDLLAPFDAKRWSLSMLTAEGPSPLSREAFRNPDKATALALARLPILFEPIRR